MMDDRCKALLPQVCQALARPGAALHDDTCVEKLLDWFIDLAQQGLSLLDHCPCLLEFVSSLCRCKSAEPVILSFAVRLLGVMAASERDFTVLRAGDVLTCAFDQSRWLSSGLWDDATVRSGWICGLQNMLKHQPALHFLVEIGVVQAVLSLQSDRSLFVVSAANRLLASLLGMSGQHHCVREVLCHITHSLRSDEAPRGLQTLRLVTECVSRCPPTLTDTLLGSVETEMTRLLQQHRSLVHPYVELLQAMDRADVLSRHFGIISLTEAMLRSVQYDTALPLAAGVAHLNTSPDGLRETAVSVILRPLQLEVKAVDPHVPGQDSTLVQLVSHKSSCVSLLCASLSSAVDLLNAGYVCEDTVRCLTDSVITLLSVCAGVTVSHTFSALIGCCRVQKCALDTLASLACGKGSAELVRDALAVLHLYLQSHQSDPVVYKKAINATLSWLCVFTPSSDVDTVLRDDLIPVLKKRLCDPRWEVRDSTLEFVTRLTVQFKDERWYGETLSCAGVWHCVWPLLSDAESYVRASAVTALGASAHLLSDTCTQEGLATLLMDILAEDTECFPRRAVMRTLCSWLARPHTLLAVLQPRLRLALRLGTADLDWEVKLLTVELAQAVAERAERVSELQALGVWDVLLECACDCDRPVARRACAVLLGLRGPLEQEGAGSVPLVEPAGRAWAHVVSQQGRVPLTEVLTALRLRDMQESLEEGSDRLHNSPRSLMQDILATTAPAHDRDQDRAVDCY